MATNTSLYSCAKVSVQINGNSPNSSGIILTQNKVEFPQINLSIPIYNISAIQIHQPIFGSNYVEIAYTNVNGLNSKLTVTFNSGGATEFAQAFFRVTEGSVQPCKTENVYTEEKSNKKDN